MPRDENPCRKTASVSPWRKVFLLLFVRHLGWLPLWHFATVSDTRQLSDHRFRSQPGCERWLTVPPNAKLWCSLRVWMESVGQVSVLLRAALSGDGDWQYHVLKRENSFPCLLRLNVIGCFWSRGYKMGGRPSRATSMSFSEGIKFRKPEAYFRNVCARVTSKTSALIFKASRERNICLLLKRYLKDIFPFCFCQKLKWIDQKSSCHSPVLFAI